MRGILTVKEHEKFGIGTPLTNGDKLNEVDISDLESVPNNVIKRSSEDGKLSASNHVGIITTRRGLFVEILPKIDLRGKADPKNEKTKQIFLRMLHCWRGLSESFDNSSIRDLAHYPMHEVFVRQFLDNLSLLTHTGLARRYITVQANLPYLRGRLLFQEQLRKNLTNQARFAVVHDKLSVNRPANRLIHSALAKLFREIRNFENRQLLRQLTSYFVDVPQSRNLHSDWQRHQVDRSMQRYRPVMQWVGLFLFNHGLTTFAGPHINISMLFPMEQVFEAFVTNSFRRYQGEYEIVAQGPMKPFAKIENSDAFMMKPDISLKDGEQTKFILDAKWKRIRGIANGPKRGIDQADMYQIYAYGKRYQSSAAALVYPRTETFTKELCYRFFDDLPLICLPFDSANPKESVRRSIETLKSHGPNNVSGASK